MMRFGLIIAAICLISAPAAAEKVYAGANGGVYCSSESDLIGTISGRIKGLGPTCKSLPSFASIDARNFARTGNVSIGGGDFGESKNIFFVAIHDVLPSASPAPPSSTPIAAASRSQSTSEPPRSEVRGSRNAKRVSPGDVRNTPDKWVGRDIEFASTQVYWVADDDVRILTGTNLTLFAKAVRSDSLAHYRSECETENEARQTKCRAIVRFTYERHGEDSPNGLFKRTVLVSSDVELIRPSGRR